MAKARIEKHTRAGVVPCAPVSASLREGEFLPRCVPLAGFSGVLVGGSTGFGIFGVFFQVAYTVISLFTGVLLVNSSPSPSGEVFQPAKV